MTARFKLFVAWLVFTGICVASLWLLPATLTHRCTYIGPIPDVVGYVPPEPTAGMCPANNGSLQTELTNLGGALIVGVFFGVLASLGLGVYSLFGIKRPYLNQKP